MSFQHPTALTTAIMIQVTNLVPLKGTVTRLSDSITLAPSDKTSATAKPAKLSKPRPDLPLGYHPAGYLRKMILGKLYYFGPRFDPSDAALDE